MILIRFFSSLTLVCMLTDSYTLLYHTENSIDTQYFDCIYYNQIKYCVQSSISSPLQREINVSCHMNGRLWSFEELSVRNISVSEVLKWSSSIEQTDRYAKYLLNGRFDQGENVICNCTNPQRFGKSCEYEFYFDSLSFNEAIENQFKPLENTSEINVGSQIMNTRLCYLSISCNLGICLDWRHICDGKQQCTNGTDEDFCELLEFNECEDDEYRCANGMCIPDEYWLDGDYDCMDWTDELHATIETGSHCFHTPTSACEEHICPYNQWSCGDGQCINDQTDRHTGTRAHIKSYCYNLRDANFMCEAVRRDSRSWWTITNGYCLPYSLAYQTLGLDTTKTTLNCVFHIKCALSNSLDQDCECKSPDECQQMIINSCPPVKIPYPLGRNILTSYISMLYDRERDWTKLRPDFLHYTGAIKCLGFQSVAKLEPKVPVGLNYKFYTYYWFELDYCVIYIHNIQWNEQNLLGAQYDLNCWNTSTTFNNHPYKISHLCATRCISIYRVRDGIADCVVPLDEYYVMLGDCSRIQRHRLQCSKNESTCLLVAALGDWGTSCSNGKDEFDEDNNLVLYRNIHCQHKTDSGCAYLRNYIQMSSNENGNTKSTNLVDQSATTIPFRSYCDSFFDTKSTIDEMPELCRNWTCLHNEYQCESGQCIPLDWICDGEWDCSDASDEQRIFILETLNPHNSKLLNLTEMKNRCQQQYRFNNTPFSNICNLSYEYPCFRKGLVNPLNLTLHRPCINISQIGDGHVDCLSGLDERNRLQCATMGMLGFHYQLDEHICVSYRKLCIEYPWIEGENRDYDSICFHQRKTYRNGTMSDCTGNNDVMCLNDICKKDARCNGKIECLHGEDEYRCIPMGKSEYVYRHEKQTANSRIVLKLRNYPLSTPSRSHSYTSNFRSINKFENEIPLIPTITILFQHLPNNTITFERNILPFLCNHGLAVQSLISIGKCLCPPSYFGAQCQVYADRITFLTHVDLTNYLLRYQQTAILKVLVTFLYQNTILDNYEFFVNPQLHNENNFIKQTIYFLYSRTSEYFQLRDTNRSATLMYSVRCEAYNLYSNESIELVGVWHYPIYFDFLPAFRLAKVLRFPLSFTSNPLCQTSNPCQNNATCHNIINRNHSSYFCSCSHGFHGQHCEFYDSRCNDYCSPSSICKPTYRGNLTGNRQPFCLCPIDTFGSTCSIKNNPCQPNPCLNQGRCLMQYDLSDINKYICLCANSFEGDHCENRKGMVRIEINSQLKSSSADILAITVVYNDYQMPSLRFLPRHQQLYNQLPTSLTLVYSQKTSTYAPAIAFLKAYSSHSLDEESKYYILYYYPNNKTISISVNLTTENYCPLILSSNSTTAMFSYHEMCRTNATYTCFHDYNYVCICEQDYPRAECFGYNRLLDSCSMCLSNGRCLQGELDDKRDFLCLCPKCHHGQMCQYSNEFMGFTLDSLIVKDTMQNHRLFSSIYMSITLLIFLFGLFNNLCSLLTFMRPSPRKFGVGNYLLIVSVVNQCSLLLLVLKMIHIIFGSNGSLFEFTNRNLYSCKIASYLLSVFTRITYWLSSFVTLERLCMVLFPTSSILKSPRLALVLSISTIIILSGMHIHEALYYTIIVDSTYTSANVTLCVTSYTKSFVSVYNRVNVLIHYFIPFVLQVISITITIIRTACSRARTSGSTGETFIDLFKKQFRTQKEHYITPIIIVFSALPQAILSFSYACTELKQSWQRYTLLSAYFLSYLPQMLGFLLHVLPSTVFSQEFYKTKLGSKFPKAKARTQTQKKLAKINLK